MTPNCAVVLTLLHYRQCRFASVSNHSQDIAVDNLHQSKLAAISGNVEGLALDTSVVDDLPLLVLFLQYGVGRLGGLSLHGVQGSSTMMLVGQANTASQVSQGLEWSSHVLTHS